MRSTIYPNDHRSQASPLAGALAGVAMAGYLLPALAFYSRTLRGALGVEAETATGEGAAITFDDGPHAQGTPAVLEILAGGHALGLHCHRHRNLLRLAPWQVREDVSRAQAAIEDATGISPALYRPPYGILNASALRIARQAARRTLLWSHWGRDWRARATPKSIAACVTKDVVQGSILLLHDAGDYSAPDAWQRTARAVRCVLDVLSERGIETVLP